MLIACFGRCNQGAVDLKDWQNAMHDMCVLRCNVCSVVCCCACRYFPEPDLPPLVLQSNLVEKVQVGRGHPHCSYPCSYTNIIPWHFIPAAVSGHSL